MGWVGKTGVKSRYQAEIRVMRDLPRMRGCAGRCGGARRWARFARWRRCASALRERIPLCRRQGGQSAIRPGSPVVCGGFSARMRGAISHVGGLATGFAATDGRAAVSLPGVAGRGRAAAPVRPRAVSPALRSRKPVQPGCGAAVLWPVVKRSMRQSCAHGDRGGLFGIGAGRLLAGGLHIAGTWLREPARCHAEPAARRAIGTARRGAPQRKRAQSGRRSGPGLGRARPEARRITRRA